MAKTKEEFNLSPEIEKLAERLAKDPSSKLFVPLAEEYLKGGMLEEAISVLKDGLKHHPSYVSARVALGKAYHKKGLIKESLEEFKKVVAANPDNLLAHKKLVEIHKALGNIEDAIKSCNTILLLNPKDEEIKGIMKQLEGIRPAPVPPPPLKEKEEKMPVEEKFEAAIKKEPEKAEIESAPRETEPIGAELIETKITEPEIIEEIKAEDKPFVLKGAAEEDTILEEPKEAFKMPADAEEEIHFEEEKKEEKPEESLWTMPEEEKPPILEEDVKAPAVEEKVYELNEERDEELEGLVKLKPAEHPKKAKEKEPEGEIPVYDIGEEELISFPKDLLQSDEEIIQESKMKEAEVTSLDISSFEKKPEEASAPKIAMPEEEMIIIEEPESEMLSVEPIIPKKEQAKEEVVFRESVLEEKAVKPLHEPVTEPRDSGEEQFASREKPKEEMATETLAELYIKQGFYEKGIEIYRKLLKEKPDNKELKQKLEDAVTLSSLFVSGQPKTEEIIPGVLVEKAEADVESIEIEEIAPPEPSVSKAKADISVKPAIERPKEPEKKAEAPKEAPQSTKGGKQKAKVQRLQSWLDNIKKEQPQL